MKRLIAATGSTLVPFLLLLMGCQATSTSEPSNEQGDVTRYSNQHAAGHNVVDSIVDRLKRSLTQIDDETVYALMVRHYQTMRLMDADGNWQAVELEAIAEELLPNGVTVDDIRTLIDVSATIAVNNDYLLDFLDMVADEPLDRLMQKIDSEGPRFLPLILTYAMVLENLTLAMHNDWRLIRTCKNIFVAARDELGIMNKLDPFYLVKLLSVEGPMLDYIKYHEAGAVPASFLKLHLPLNIMEAVGTDISRDNEDNARAGIVLAFHKPGDAPARFSDEGKSIVVSMPEPKLWADLYATWNLGFVSHYPHFPFTIVKLLIPSVNDYEHLPGEYIYDRSLALYTGLHFTFFTQHDQAMSGQRGIDWFDESLWTTFAKANLRSARRYSDVTGR